MRDWEQLFAEAKNSGVYPIDEDAIPDVRNAASRAGLAQFDLNLKGVQGKSEFLTTAAKVLNLPAHFGHNWDALEDCLTDLSWLDAGGYLLLIENPEDFIQNAPKEMSIARSILQDAAVFWKEQDIRFFVALVENS